MCRALYSSLHQLVEAQVPTWILGMLVVQLSFGVLPPAHLMTTITAAPDGALSAFPSRSLSHMSRWNELRSSSTVPLFGRSTSWSSGEAFGRCKEQYSTVRECCSTCLSNYGSRTHHRYVMAPPPTPKSYKYSSPFGLERGGRDSVGLVYIGLATQESFTDLRLSPGSSLVPGICRNPSMIFTIN